MYIAYGATGIGMQILRLSRIYEFSFYIGHIQMDMGFEPIAGERDMHAACRVTAATI